MTTIEKVKKTIEVEKDTNTLLEIMAQKAHLDTNKILETMARYWINDNLDLLTAKELEKFKHLFYDTK